jgi:hypothetical protein
VIEVQLAASDDVAKFLAEGRLKLIHGMLGVSVAFTRASGWRPTVIREVHTLDSLDDSGRAGMERHTFGGVDAMVLRTYQWSQWAKLAQLMIPTQREADLRVRIDTAGLVPHRHTSRATMKAELLASPPDSSAFELAPPDWMGPVGRVNNADTGVVEVYDSRGLAERLDSRGQFVSLLSEAAKKSHYQPAGDSMPWYSAAFLWGGCVSLMCCFWQLATRRRGSAV